LPLDTPELKNAVEIVPTGEAVIEQIVPTTDVLMLAICSAARLRSGALGGR